MGQEQGAGRGRTHCKEKPKVWGRTSPTPSSCLRTRRLEGAGLVSQAVGAPAPSYVGLMFPSPVVTQQNT